MKTIFSIVFLFTSLAFAKSFVCVDQVNSETEINSYFDSTAPVLESIITYKSEAEAREKRTTYISSIDACNVPVDFQSDCQTNESQNKYGYSFKFECKQQKLNGSFYVDEFGSGEFRCNNQTPYVFLNCNAQ